MEKVYDMHVHHTFEIPIDKTIEIFSLEFPVTETERYAFLSIPNEVSTDGCFYLRLMQNIRILYLKHVFSPNAFAFSGLEHPVGVAQMDDRELSRLYLNEAEEYYSAGFDGMKMLEGYPSLRKAMKRPLDHKVYDEYYSFLEENNIPITMHLGNPAENWDINLVDEYSKSVGRYCDSTFPTKESLHKEVDGILKKHPRLRLTLAHFGFMSYDIEMARRWFDEHENTCLDITPGGEQLINMRNNWEEWQRVFEDYSDRIIYGSDYYAFPMNESWKTNFTRRPNFLRNFFEGDGEYDYGKRHFKGVALDKTLRDKIYRENASRLYGEPRKLDTEYIRRKAEELLKRQDKIEEFADSDLKYILENIK